MTEVDRDRTKTETWSEWCAKDRTVTGTAQPYEAEEKDLLTAGGESREKGRRELRPAGREYKEYQKDTSRICLKEGYFSNLLSIFLIQELSRVFLSGEETMAQMKPTIPDAIHKLQLCLLEQGPISQRHLFAAGSLLSRSDYEDVVTERSIVGLCGYPCCSNNLPPTLPRRGRYKISLSEHKVYDLQETYKFCSENCVVSSRSFSGSLMLDRCDSVGFAKVSGILKLFEKQKAEDNFLETELGLSKLSIREKSGEIGEVIGDERIGASYAVEGYVPLRDRNKGLLDVLFVDFLFFIFSLYFVLIRIFSF